eukprot:CAMPEP_0184738228 /NCGR_PEP_ID=MMETSP0315-20130426/939_1 /TAXON_ID=101924 /ORGANISM="Rhodosorus marinus, Strain UTEX LB 2760" /LENGTH=356 /DNA_ID=CAMNT_0027205861 /DNA_START=43 /DNA_END=1113 /DNA_ORIENTATION=+
MGSLLNVNRYEQEFLKNKSDTVELTTRSRANTYFARFKEDSEELQNHRNAVTDKGAGKDLVQEYYSISTDLYEFGWGESFHFGILWADSSFEDAIRRYEYFLALKMKLNKDDVVLDLGCGVGGPMRNIARFSGAQIIGVNISEYQVYRANLLNRKAGLMNQCMARTGDFTKLEFDDSSVDGAYAIEATCHTNDKDSVYSEAFRVLKPGAYFAAWEWVTTDKYDANNPEHQRVRFNLEKGNGLPETAPWHEVIASLKRCGFEVIEYFDGCEQGEVPWWNSLNSGWSLRGFSRTWFGIRFTGALLWALEKVGIVSQGMYEAQNNLQLGADMLVQGGKMGIYSPMFFFLARKPTAEDAS